MSRSPFICLPPRPKISASSWRNCRSCRRFRPIRRGMEEVFTNLITNAIKYSPANSRFLCRRPSKMTMSPSPFGIPALVSRRRIWRRSSPASIGSKTAIPGKSMAPVWVLPSSKASSMPITAASRWRANWGREPPSPSCCRRQVPEAAFFLEVEAGAPAGAYRQRAQNQYLPTGIE